MPEKIKLATKTHKPRPTAASMPQYRCVICGRLRRSEWFFACKHPTEEYPTGHLLICKDCLLDNFDYADPNTFMNVIKALDVPWIPYIYRNCCDRCSQSSKNPRSILGRYVGQLKLEQYKNLTLADSKEQQYFLEPDAPFDDPEQYPGINTPLGEASPYPSMDISQPLDLPPRNCFKVPVRHMRGARTTVDGTVLTEGTVQLANKAGTLVTDDEIRNGSFANFASTYTAHTKAPKEWSHPVEETAAPVPVDPATAAISAIAAPPAEGITDPSQGLPQYSSPMSALNGPLASVAITQDEDLYLKGKWGLGYTRVQYLTLEKSYLDLLQDFDIRTTSQKDYLRKLCSASLRYDESLSASNSDEAAKWGRIYSSLSKESGLQPVQGNETQDEYLDAVGTLVKMAEDNDDFIPKWDTTEPRDKLDIILKDYKLFIKRLVEQNGDIASHIDVATTSLQAQDKVVNNKQTEETAAEAATVLGAAASAPTPTSSSTAGGSSSSSSSSGDEDDPVSNLYDVYDEIDKPISRKGGEEED